MTTIKKIFLFALLAGLSLKGISQQASVETIPAGEEDVITENTKGYYSQVFGFQVKTLGPPGLFDLIANWIGTPYCYSGKSASGIDCSGFVSMLYQQYYHMPFSGNAAEMYSRITPVKKHHLQAGDLVFFKIRKKRISHVGIYIGENKFAHASTTNGVIISDLDQPYYKKYFVKGGKVKNTF